MCIVYLGISIKQFNLLNFLKNLEKLSSKVKTYDSKKKNRKFLKISQGDIWRNSSNSIKT